MTPKKIKCYVDGDDENNDDGDNIKKLNMSKTDYDFMELIFTTLSSEYDSLIDVMEEHSVITCLDNLLYFINVVVNVMTYYNNNNNKATVDTLKQLVDSLDVCAYQIRVIRSIIGKISKNHFFEEYKDYKYLLSVILSQVALPIFPEWNNCKIENDDKSDGDDLPF